MFLHLPSALTEFLGIVVKLLELMSATVPQPEFSMIASVFFAIWYFRQESILERRRRQQQPRFDAYYVTDVEFGRKHQPRGSNSFYR